MVEAIKRYCFGCEQSHTILLDDFLHLVPSPMWFSTLCVVSKNQNLICSSGKTVTEERWCWPLMLYNYSLYFKIPIYYLCLLVILPSLFSSMANKADIIQETEFEPESQSAGKKTVSRRRRVLFDPEDAVEPLLCTPDKVSEFVHACCPHHSRCC